MMSISLLSKLHKSPDGKDDSDDEHGDEES